MQCDRIGIWTLSAGQEQTNFSSCQLEFQFSSDSEFKLKSASRGKVINFACLWCKSLYFKLLVLTRCMVIGRFGIRRAYVSCGDEQNFPNWSSQIFNERTLDVHKLFHRSFTDVFIESSAKNLWLRFGAEAQNAWWMNTHSFTLLKIFNQKSWKPLFDIDNKGNASNRKSKFVIFFSRL